MPEKKTETSAHCWKFKTPLKLSTGIARENSGLHRHAVKQPGTR